MRYIIPYLDFWGLPFVDSRDPFGSSHYHDAAVFTREMYSSTIFYTIPVYGRYYLSEKKKKLIIVSDYSVVGAKTIGFTDDGRER